PTLCLPLPLHPCPTLFPYTTLFRSPASDSPSVCLAFFAWGFSFSSSESLIPISASLCTSIQPPESSLSSSSSMFQLSHFSSASRSEEHTSELQSRFDLVCRLLL